MKPYRQILISLFSLLFVFVFLRADVLAQGPTVTISSPVAPFTQVFDSIPFHIHFSTKVNGFIATDMQVINGNVIYLTPLTRDSFFIAYVQPTSCARVTMKIFAGAAQDSLAQQSQGAQDFSLRADTCHPVITFTPTQGNPTGANPVPLHIDFSEPVLGFTASDITIDSGTVSGGITSLQGADSLFMVDIAPNPGAGIKVFTVSIDSGAVTDQVGLTNDSTWIVIVYNPAFASSEVYHNMPDLEIYPNPGNGILYLRNARGNFDRWQLISVQGQSLYEGSMLSQDRLDMGDIPEGSYWLLLQGQDTRAARKILIRK